ncbi:hypothetical protein [Macrococcoides canis]|uniref:hypothetical protein n=1 Tax=Macrococcoides canis TaxID=1855823 RepID=UPI0022B8ECD4|nr:hypothetical protein [Macrococcus canis]WBF53767.1 hypothetical protein LL975_05615 [Macrococcus canis]
MEKQYRIELAYKVLLSIVDGMPKSTWDIISERINKLYEDKAKKIVIDKKEVVVDMKTCKKCHTLHPKHHVYCQFCGNKF